jgi:L-threonylcarbamoyladenylate synthase
LFEHAVQRAAELLRAGELVALPTETVYGLAADARNAKAVAKIFEAKGRPSNNPLIVHVSSADMAGSCVESWPEPATSLARAFWPGPLTLVLPRSREIPDIVTAGGETIGVRWPSHPFIQAVIRECGFPLAAPSANLSNRISPTNAAHVRESLADKVRLIIDGGQSQVGIESTVVDLAVDPPCVLRPGMIHVESLLAVLGADGLSSDAGAGDGSAGEPMRSPGGLPKHYAPKAKLLVLTWHDEAGLMSQLRELGASLESTHIIAFSHIPSSAGLGGVSVIPHDVEAYARAIYAELHRCDAEGAELIVVESLPDGPEWRALTDRLRRAAS